MEKETESTTGLDYAGGKISSLFFKIFFPTLLGMIFNALLTIIDGIFVGRGVGPDGIAAVNIIAPLYMIVTGIGLMFGIGTSVISGIALSHGDNRRASINLTQAIIISGTLIATLCLILGLTPDWSARTLGSSGRLHPYAVDYLLWLLPGMFFLLFQVIGMMVIRLDGSPKYAMLCNIISATVNIVLDWYCVFPLGLGVKGAAIATSASIMLGAAMVLIYFLRYSYVIRFHWSTQDFFSNTWRQVCVGSSAFITETAMSVMMLTGNFVFMTNFGEAGVAAYSIACYLFPLLFMISNAVAQSAQPIISFNYGAGNTARTTKAFRISLYVALLCGAISTLSIAFGSRTIVALLIDPACPAGRLAISGLPYFASCAIFFAANIAYIGYCQSIEDSVKAAVYTLLRGVIYLVPIYLLLPRILPTDTIWLAIPLSEILTLATILLTRHITTSSHATTA